MKVNTYICGSLLLILLLCTCCKRDNAKTGESTTDGLMTDDKSAPEHLNISVYLDLSDRLERDLTPSQMYRDTAIVNYLADYFKKKTFESKILKSKNKMKIIFYPTPADPNISTLADQLSVDMKEKKGSEKKAALKEMKTTFQNSLEQIYQLALNAKEFPGCDIWAFFSNKKVDNLCIRDNARNVVIILTDGYLFMADNKIKQGDSAYSYILPQTLAKNGKLIDKRKGELKGKNLEVLMLEVNAYNSAEQDKMIPVLEEWFAAMGVEKFKIVETDANLTNTKSQIDEFLKPEKSKK